MGELRQPLILKILWTNQSRNKPNKKSYFFKVKETSYQNPSINCDLLNVDEPWLPTFDSVTKSGRNDNPSNYTDFNKWSISNKGCLKILMLSYWKKMLIVTRWYRQNILRQMLISHIFINRRICFRQYLYIFV